MYIDMIIRLTCQMGCHSVTVWADSYLYDRLAVAVLRCKVEADGFCVFLEKHYIL